MNSLRLVVAATVVAASACSGAPSASAPTASRSAAPRSVTATPKPPVETPTSPGADIVPVSWVDTGQPDATLFPGRDVVISASEKRVVAIDARTGNVRWTTEVPGSQAAVGFGSVWLTDYGADLVRRLDVRDGSLQREIQVRNKPIGVLVHEGYVWLSTHQGGAVLRIDPANDTVASTTRVGPEGPDGPLDLAAAGEHVYVGVPSTNSVVRLNASDAKVTRRVTLPRGASPCGPLTVDGSVVWVTACREKGVVARVDMRTGRVVRSDDLDVYLGDGLVRGRLIWFPGAPLAFSVDPASIPRMVALDRATGRVVRRLHSAATSDSATTVSGSWWVAQAVGGQNGVGRFRLTDLDLDR